MDDYNWLDELPFWYRQELIDRVIRKRPALPYATRGKGSVIAHLQPHYTDDRFKHPQTVYLDPEYTVQPDGEYEWVEGASYDYSDRVYGWFAHEKIEAAWAVADHSGHDPRCAAGIELFLQALYEAPDLKLVHILAGYNWATGYSYQVYGYIKEPAHPDED